MRVQDRHAIKISENARLPSLGEGHRCPAALRAEIALLEQRLRMATTILGIKDNLNECARRAVYQFIVGMENSAPSLTPEGQREVTVLVLV
jgi:hypothetical protein